jgi:hypothetical protein
VKKRCSAIASTSAAAMSATKLALKSFVVLIKRVTILAPGLHWTWPRCKPRVVERRPQMPHPPPPVRKQPRIVSSYVPLRKRLAPSAASWATTPGLCRCAPLKRPVWPVCSAAHAWKLSHRTRPLLPCPQCRLPSPPSRRFSPSRSKRLPPWYPLRSHSQSLLSAHPTPHLLPQSIHPPNTGCAGTARRAIPRLRPVRRIQPAQPRN